MTAGFSEVTLFFWKRDLCKYKIFFMGSSLCFNRVCIVDVKLKMYKFDEIKMLNFV